MRNPRIIAAACVAALPFGAPAASLTDSEWQWLRGVEPVMQYAEAAQLPVDIVVQPQDTPGVPPLAMAFVKGRCKLVLSLRGNPAAAATLTGVPTDLLPSVLQAMAAHELGHCWRHVNGTWAVLPAGFTERPGPEGEDVHTVTLRRSLEETRREEGFSDLVGLAWTRAQQPAQYERVRHWLERTRGDETTPLSHATQHWLRLARDGATLDGEGSIFDRALAVWKQGLRSVD